jgi:hypothetical protein
MDDLFSRLDWQSLRASVPTQFLHFWWNWVLGCKLLLN